MPELARLRRLAASLAVAVMLAPGPAHAQFSAGGRTLRCPAAGETVRTVQSRSLKMPAHADILRGRRVILVNPLILARYPPLIQLFLYARECGVQTEASAHGTALDQVRTPDRERAADRAGIRLMRDQLRISLQDAEKIAAAVAPGPPALPLPFFERDRAKWIVDCFRSRDDACTAEPMSAS